MKCVFLFVVCFWTQAVFAQIPDQQTFKFTGIPELEFQLSKHLRAQSHTSYCNEQGSYQTGETKCEMVTRQRSVCHTQNGSEGSRGCWVENWEEEVCTPVTVRWGSSTPCGTSNSSERLINYDVKVLFEDIDDKNLSFNVSVDNGGNLELKNTLLPAGMILGKKIEYERIGTSESRATIRLKLLSISDLLTRLPKAVTAKYDQKNERLKLDFKNIDARNFRIFISAKNFGTFLWGDQKQFFSGNYVTCDEKCDAINNWDPMWNEKLKALEFAILDSSLGATAFEIDFYGTGLPLERAKNLIVRIEHRLDESLEWSGVTSKLNTIIQTKLKVAK